MPQMNPTPAIESNNSKDAVALTETQVRVAQVQRVLLDISKDCQTDTENYLDETVVPYGGE